MRPATAVYFSTKVADWITHYIRPQDNANRTDIRWIQLTDSSASGLAIRAEQQSLGVSAWLYSQEDRETATHDYQLPHRDFITVNVDGFQMGVGGDTSWGLPVHNEYRLRDKGTYEFSFDLCDAAPQSEPSQP